MKIISEEMQEQHTQATINGAIRGTGYAFGGLVPSHFILRRYSNVYRQIPITLKAFGYVTLGLMTISITAEKAGEAFDAAQWTGAGQKTIEAAAVQREKRWEEMTRLEQVGDTMKKYKFPIIGASWVAAMSGSFALVSRNNPASFANRLVQARVYAQAWTVLLFIVAVGAAQTDSGSESSKDKKTDHSWRDIIAQNETIERVERERERRERAKQMADAAHLSKPKIGE